MRRVQRVSPLPNRAFDIYSDYASSASAQMVQHRLGDFEAHAEALRPVAGVRRRSCNHLPETPDGASSADLAFGQPRTLFASMLCVMGRNKG
jgi:hypothetical protein